MAKKAKKKAAASGSAPASPRRRMQDAALRLFERNGFEATTIDEIVATAGVSRSSFFRSFATK